MITVIIPVHNLDRGLERVYFSLYSIYVGGFTPHVIVVDSSTDRYYNNLHNLIKGFDFVTHIRRPNKEFNKPRLLNEGIKASNSDFIMCTDADYLFSHDFFSTLNPTSAAMITKRVIMLPKQVVSEQKIEDWDFVKGDVAPGGRDANGGCQLASREWFEYCGGYDERMKGWCAMDNDMVLRAERFGLRVHWHGPGEILHQYHRQEKLKKGDDIAQSKRNWNIRDHDKSIIRNARNH